MNRIELIPSMELTEAYNKWVKNGIAEFEPCKEAVAYVTDTPVERILESVQLVASNVVAVCCIGELLIYYKDNKLDMSRLIKILMKYGLITIAIYLVPMLFHKYL